jgi:hypothetical protein
MSFEVGTHLYRYSVKHNKLHLHAGVVNQCINRKVVVFPDGGFRHSAVHCPREEDIGVVRNVGFHLWLTERDDELAKQIFIEYEERQINRMNRLIVEKQEVINMLRGEPNDE